MFETGAETRCEAPQASAKGSETHTAKRINENPANNGVKAMAVRCRHEGHECVGVVVLDHLRREAGSRRCIKALGLVTHYDSTQMIFRRRRSKSGMYLTIVATSSTVAKRNRNDDGCTSSKNSSYISLFNFSAYFTLMAMVAPRLAGIASSQLAFDARPPVNLRDALRVLEFRRFSQSVRSVSKQL
jgi:hypothetical protein